MSAPSLLQQADLCVKCGLCLPHCPTYQQTGHEADSPRGRIALIQGLANGQLQATPSLNRHLDGCLACRSCEAVCPAQVPYGALLDGGRALQNQQRPAATRRYRWIAVGLTQPALRALWLAPLWLLQKTGLLAWLARWPLGHTKRLLQRLPRLHWPGSPAQPMLSPDAPAVQLFLGCTGEWMDAETLHDSVYVLNRIGYRVHIPAAQQCCGALHQHAGLTEVATRYAAANQRAFDPALPVISFASGCGAGLKDAGCTTIQDLSHFLLQHWPATLQPRALPQRIAVHQPCTLRNVMGTAASVTALLRKIPQLDVVELPRKTACCGAAGSHMLTQPVAADTLGKTVLDALHPLAATTLVSSNIGCSLHLGALLRQDGSLKEPVRHPVSLLAAQLRSG